MSDVIEKMQTSAENKMVTPSENKAKRGRPRKVSGASFSWESRAHLRTKIARRLEQASDDDLQAVADVLGCE